MIPFLRPRATFRGTLAEGADGARVDRLAALSATRSPEGVVLLAEIEGEPVAAVGLFDRHTVVDPARSSLAVRMGLHLLRLQVRLIVAVRGL
jgi:hypothetical protein